MNAFWTELTFEPADDQTYTLRLKTPETVEIGNDQTGAAVVVPVDVLLSMADKVDDLLDAPELELTAQENA